MVEENLTWEVKQTKATVDPRDEHYNALSAFSKTVRRAEDGSLEWGGSFKPESCAPLKRSDELHCLSQRMESELFRLPSSSEGK